MTRHMLNKFVRSAFALLLGIGAAAYAGVPPMEVTVFGASGKVAYQGATGADATFATPNLHPGNYVVQFNTKSAGVKNNHYLLVVSTGKKKVIADAVPGEKFTAGGVAMKVDVGSGLKIAGQIARAEGGASNGSPRVIVQNGKRFAWVTAQTGSNLGGHWVEVGAGEERHIFRLSSDEIRKIQDRAGEGNLLNRYEHHFYEHPEGY
ncbi:MAG: T9SS type A sorting domain-containing protein [Chthoniobacterales bacterium]